MALLPGQALACGGFFCDQLEPVDQMGERVVFAVDGDTVTMHVQRVLVCERLALRTVRAVCRPWCGAALFGKAFV